MSSRPLLDPKFSDGMKIGNNVVMSSSVSGIGLGGSVVLAIDGDSAALVVGLRGGVVGISVEGVVGGSVGGVVGGRVGVVVNGSVGGVVTCSVEGVVCDSVMAGCVVVEGSGSRYT